MFEGVPSVIEYGNTDVTCPVFSWPAQIDTDKKCKLAGARGELEGKLS